MESSQVLENTSPYIFLGTSWVPDTGIEKDAQLRAVLVRDFICRKKLVPLQRFYDIST